MNSITQRCRELTRDLAADPTLPLLGWTKAVEAVVTGGLVRRWVIVAVVVTLVWVLGAELKRQADEVTDAAADAVEEATDS